MMEEKKETVVQTEQVVKTKPAEVAAVTPAAPAPDRAPRRDSRPPVKRGRRRRFTPQKKDYDERVVNINRVSKTTKGGRRLRFGAVVVIGYGKGKYGFASAKAAEVPDAIKKAIDVARKDTFTFELVKGDTIAHEIVGKFGACSVFLKPAPEGTGIIAGGPVRAILELAGVRNVYSKVYGSRTPLNILRATDNGLKGLKSREEVMRLRGL